MTADVRKDAAHSTCSMCWAGVAHHDGTETRRGMIGPGLADRSRTTCPGGIELLPPAPRPRYCSVVPETSAISSARLVRRALLAALALALGLTCMVLAVAVASGMTSDDMGGMSKAASPADSGVTVADGVPVAAEVTQRVMTSMCAHPCAGVTTGDLCTAAAGVLLASVLVLILASNRNTFLGLNARLRRQVVLPLRIRQRTPWLVLSPASLCVFRV